jgi:ribosomal protein S18 acetylase RimI-like enzyme
MENPIEIERATEDDLKSTLDLLRDQFAEHQIELSEGDLRKAVLEVLQNDRLGFVLIAREAKRAIGAACISFAWTLEHGGKSAWLDELYVLPAYRRRGVGTALLREVIGVAGEMGCAAIDLEVEHNHRQAERLYQREGFEVLDRRRWVKKTILKRVSNS